ncbi:hypothetical protein [Sphingopyxis panaciterrae]
MGGGAVGGAVGGRSLAPPFDWIEREFDAVLAARAEFAARDAA